MTNLERLTEEQLGKLTVEQQGKVNTLTEEKLEELTNFLTYTNLLSSVNEGLLAIRETELGLAEEDKTLRDEDWIVLNLFHENKFSIVGIVLKGEEVTFHVESEFEIEDDETGEKEVIQAEMAVIYNFIGNQVVNGDSWLNFKNSDRIKDASIFTNPVA